MTSPNDTPDAGPGAGRARTARERARAELTREIKEEARRQLAAVGADGLSLRAVARELGMVSSALYRYYPSRDDLLTALIIDAYNALGDAAERAIAATTAGGAVGEASAGQGSAGGGRAGGALAGEGSGGEGSGGEGSVGKGAAGRGAVDGNEAGGAAAGGGSPGQRAAGGGAGARGGDARAAWVAACHAVRDWARANPYEYALIYGSPVPGYRAPEATIGPAARVPLAFVGVLADAAASGEIGERGQRGAGAEGGAGRPLAGVLRDQADRLAAALSAPAADRGAGWPALPRVPAEVLVRAVMAWTQLFGMISFELFGQFVGSFEPADALFAHAVNELASSVGLR